MEKVEVETEEWWKMAELEKGERWRLREEVVEVELWHRRGGEGEQWYYIKRVRLQYVLCR